MDVRLRGDDVRQHLPPAHHGGGGLVAGRLDAEDQRVHGSRGTVSGDHHAGGPEARFAVAAPDPQSATRAASYGGRTTPRSVMIAVINPCGVTSKAGWMTGTPSGTMR